MFNLTHPSEAPPRSGSWIPYVPGFLQPFVGAILLASLLYLKMMVDLSPVLTPLRRILGPVWRFLVAQVVKTLERSEEQRQNALFKSYENIQALSDFNWMATEPLQLRPFKPTYHMTMALEYCPLSELYVFDNTYKERIKLRRDLLSEHTANIIEMTHRAPAPIQEFYSWMVCNYLPKRYPTIFSLGINYKQDPVLHNAVLKEDMPLSAPNAFQALMILNSHIDTDFFFLLPEDERVASPTSASADLDEAPPPRGNSDPKYVLEAFVNAFPSGFNTPSKLGHNLAGIHRPVPGYPQKLERSMDRYFASLPLGKAVKRANWTVTPDPTLYQPSGPHMNDEAESQSLSNEELARQRREAARRVEAGDAILRCERQTLHRLPGSRAIVFSFKTYSYPLEQVWREGSGERMAEAIEGISKGSVPRMFWYKSVAVWGDAVCKYLRHPVPDHLKLPVESKGPKEKDKKTRKDKTGKREKETVEQQIRKELEMERKKMQLEQERRAFLQQQEAERREREMHYRWQWEEDRRREEEYQQWQAEEERRRQWGVVRMQDWQRTPSYDYDYGPPSGYSMYARP